MDVINVLEGLEKWSDEAVVWGSGREISRELNPDAFIITPEPRSIKTLIDELRYLDPGTTVYASGKTRDGGNGVITINDPQNRTNAEHGYGGIITHFFPEQA